MGLFNDRLKELKEEKDIMLKDLASDLEIANSKLSYYLNGNSEPPYELLVKIARYFKVTTDYLTGMSDYRRFEDVTLANSISAKSDVFENIDNQRQIEIDKNCVMLHDLLLRVSFMQVQDEGGSFDDVWKMVKLWLNGLEKHIIFEESCLNDEFLLDNGRLAMNNFSLARMLAGNRITRYLATILEADNIEQDTKDLIVKRISYSIKTPKSDEEDKVELSNSPNAED